MGCQSEVAIGQNLVFSVVTHDNTGEATDADANPIYRVYEDMTAAPIVTGTMDIHDAANTTGYYQATIVCSVANGFENNHSYNIYVQATVGGATGGISFGFIAKTDCSCPTGPGAVQVTYVLTDSATTLPIADADIWVTTDIAGTNTIASGRTDASGEIDFWLDSGVTYYVWRQKDGYNFVNPDTEVVP